MQPPLPSLQTPAKTLWRYAFFNLILLGLLAAWFWQQNQGVVLAEPEMTADGKLQCVSYAPYYGKGQTPFLAGTIISTAQIDHDMALLAKRSQCVRIYSVGQGLDYVPQAASRLGLKVLLGAWIGWTPTDNEKEMALAIRLANQYPGTVKALVVGNEVLLRREQTEATIAAYLNRARNETNVPVTYADVWEFWLKHKNLEKSVDFVTVHVLPYWEDDPQSITNARQHVHAVMDKLKASFSKPVLIGETGWPSVGRQRGPSAPGLVNQARYLREFLQLARQQGWNYNVIEAIDQPWKRLLEGTVGGYWGLYDSDLQPKFGFSGLVAERHDGWLPLGFGLLGVLILGGFALAQGERRPSALLGATSLGALMAAIGLLQMQYLLAACRDLTEWIALGGIVIIGWLGLLSLPLLWKTPSQDSARSIIKICLAVLVTGAAIASCLLLIDGRYRDFPLVLYALPILQLSPGLRLVNIGTRTEWRGFYYINGIAMAAAFACAAIEPGNMDALLWAGLVILLVCATWPKRLPSA
jgi:exo-beta-1,3-glucanase (GH17 family)